MICLNGNQVSDCEGLSLEDFIAKQNLRRTKLRLKSTVRLFQRKITKRFR